MRHFLMLLLFCACYSQAEIVADIEASRTECISPCTVVFSAQETTDTKTPDEHDVFKNLGYAFDFDDPFSGTYRFSGKPKNQQEGGPIASHTFKCDTGICQYMVTVTVKNIYGDIDNDHVTVKVVSPDEYYLPSMTWCISTKGDYNGCPDGAKQMAMLPANNDYSYKRILFKRGEYFDEKICMEYGAKFTWFGSYGSDELDKPELTNGAVIGYGRDCKHFDVSTDHAQKLGDKWLHQITLTDLRIHNVKIGASYDHVELNSLDMNYFDESSGGYIHMASGTTSCVLKPEYLDCAYMPYPNGLYLSELEVVTSDAQAMSGSEEVVVIAGYNCPMINWLAMVDTEYWNSYSNQFRLQGAQRVSIAHNNARGHTRGPASRHTLTMRTCGHTDVDIKKWIENRAGRHRTGAGEPGSPWTRWIVFADNTHGSSDATGTSWKMKIAPSNQRETNTVVDTIVENSLFISGDRKTADVAINGFHVTVRGNTESGDREHCVDMGPGNNPVYGFIDCDGDEPPLP